MADNTALKLSEFGQTLKEGREAKGLTVEQITDSTRIRVAYITAMEEGRFSDLPGDVYQRLYLKAYADAIQKNPDAVLEQFKRALEDSPKGKAPAAEPIEKLIPKKEKKEKKAKKESKAKPEEADADDEPAVSNDNAKPSEKEKKAAKEEKAEKVEKKEEIKPNEYKESRNPSGKTIALSIIIAALVIVAVVVINSMSGSQTADNSVAVSSEPEFSELVLMVTDSTSLNITAGEESVVSEESLSAGDVVFVEYAQNISIDASNANSIELFIADEYVANISDFPTEDGVILINHDDILSRLQPTS